jgi:hypothetical protein
MAEITFALPLSMGLPRCRKIVSVKPQTLNYRDPFCACAKHKIHFEENNLKG